MRFIQNFWLKVIAVVMGILIWLHVATEKTYNYELMMPITEIALADSLTLADSPPDSLYVQVSANGKQLLRRKWRDRGLRINAVSYGEGRHTMTLTNEQVTFAGPSNDINLDEIIFPAQVPLDIDREATIRLPLEPQVRAEADDGYAVSAVEVISPQAAELTGPESTIRNVDTIYTAERELRSLRSSVSLRLPLVTPRGYGYSVFPDSARVEVEVVPVKTRVYDNLPIVVYHAPGGSMVATEPSTIRVDLTGPPDDIDLLNRNALIVSADFREMTDDSTVALKVDVPAGFQVRNKSADSVRLRVQ